MSDPKVVVAEQVPEAVVLGGAAPNSPLVYFSNLQAPIPQFQEMDPKTRVALQQQRNVMKKKFGYKSSYGPLVPTPQGDVKRKKAELQADDWFFAQLGRATPLGQRMQAMRQYFDMAKRDMGFKDDYGPLTMKAKGDKKRAEAEKKALRYTADKFGEAPEGIASWLLTIESE